MAKTTPAPVESVAQKKMASFFVPDGDEIPAPGTKDEFNNNVFQVSRELVEVLRKLWRDPQTEAEPVPPIKDPKADIDKLNARLDAEYAIYYRIPD